MNKIAKVPTKFQTPTADGPTSLENESNTMSGGTGLQCAFNQHISNAEQDNNANLLMESHETIDKLEQQKANLQRQLDLYKRKEQDMMNGDLDADEALTSFNVLISYNWMDSDDNKVK